MPYDRTVGAYIERKQAIATDLTTREMQELSYQIRERAFWSATVNNAKVVNTMQRACADFAKGNLSMSDARLAIQKALDSVGYKPADGTKGSIRDLNTFRRQDLIRFKMQDGRNVFNGKSWFCKDATTETHWDYFPIPKTALDANLNLKQNEGYQD